MRRPQGTGEERERDDVYGYLARIKRGIKGLITGMLPENEASVRLGQL